MSQIGLGCVTFGREINQEQSFEMMDYALENNISLFDTASAYQNGTSETIVGKWLESRRSEIDQIIVATKIAPPYKYDSMVESVDQSLKRLGLDRINLLYFHSWDDSVFTEDALYTIDKLIKQGKIHQIGASNFSENQLRDSIAIQKNNAFTTFQYVQNNHNLAVSDLTQDFMELCRNNKIEVITYSPLGAGFLTGKYDSGMITGSRFQIIPEHQKVYFNKEALRKLEMLRDLSYSTGYSTTHLALVWAYNQPGVKSVLIGGRNISQLEQAFTAKQFNEKEVLADLNRISGWII